MVQSLQALLPLVSIRNERSVCVNQCDYFILLSKAYWFLVKCVGFLCHFYYFNAPVILDISTLVYLWTTLYIIIYIITILVPTDLCTCMYCVCCRSCYNICCVNTLKVVQVLPWAAFIWLLQLGLGTVSACMLVFFSPRVRLLVQMFGTKLLFF